MDEKSTTSKKKQRNLMDPTSMHILKKRILGMKTDEIVRKSITDYYREVGKLEPNWQNQRNDQWFKDYCKELTDN